MTDKRTFLAWFEYLDTPGRELNLSEFMALLLAQSREFNRVTMEQAKQQREATEHLEGMIGTLDEFIAAVNPVHRRLAAKRGAMVPMLPDREAS